MVRMLSGDARRVVFAPLDDGWGRSEAVARRLGSAIAMGLIGDGEQLPSEQDLAFSLNVSTVTLREALSDLRGKGLVETRRGRGGGSFVKASPVALAELSQRRLAEMGVSELRELGDVHMAVAGTAARLAAGRASKTEIARLRSLAAKVGESHDQAELRRIDGRFFIEAAAAAQSVRLTMQEIGLQGELAQLSWPLTTDAGHRARLAAGRGAIADAIAGRDGDQARKLTEAQLREDTQRLIAEHIELTRGTADEEGAGDG
jgi:DNA-binding FadR family transcriptional regulator